MGEAAKTHFELIMEFLNQTKWTFTHIADDLGLSPPQAHTLYLIEPLHSAPMRDVAEAMRCDPSNITVIIDKLESSGYVERRAGSEDRRVKELVLTEKGERIRSEIIERFSREMPTVVNLTPEQQTQFCELLRCTLEPKTD